MPVISAACLKEPSKYSLWQNPRGSALVSKVSFLFKSLEVMRGNIWYKKSCSHCWDLVTAQESQGHNFNPSHIKVCADVYFASDKQGISLNAYFSFLLMEYYFKSKTEKKPPKTTTTKKKQIQKPSSQASHLRPRSDFL